MSCDMISDNGTKCVNNTEFVKIKKYQYKNKLIQIPETISCKNYCYQHSDLIINTLRKKFDIVYINDIKYNISNINILLNLKSINSYTDIQIKNLMKNKLNVIIEIQLKENINTQLITNFKNEWGQNKERWITTQDWVINNDNKLIYKYDIEYVSNVKRNNESIICLESVDNLQSLGKGGYGETQRSGDIVVKNMDLLYEYKNDVKLIYNNLRELLFLSKFHHNNISYLKCIEPEISYKYEILPTSKTSGNINDKLLKMHLKYDGITMDKISLHEYNLPNKNLLNTNLVNKSNLVYVIYQLMNLFSQLDSMDIIHGDLKPANILINDIYKVTVIDWGSVSFNTYGKAMSNGTYDFVDPDSYFPDVKEIGSKNDVYSIGMCILYLYNKMYLNLINNIEPLYEISSNIDLSNINDSFIKNIVKDCVELYYDYRLSATEILQKYFNNINIFYYKFKITKNLYFDYNEVINFKFKNSENNFLNAIQCRNYCIDMLLKYCIQLNIWKCFVLSVYTFDYYCYILNDDDNLYIEYLQLYCICCLTLSYICVYNDFKGNNIEKYLLDVAQNLSKNNEIFSYKNFYISILNILEFCEYNIYKITFDTSLHYLNFDSNSELLTVCNILSIICKDINIIQLNDFEIVKYYNNYIQNNNLTNYLI